MKQLTEDYCSFEIAKILKEKGFKQKCDYATSWYAAEYYKNSAQGEWFEGEHQIIEDIDDKCTISYLSDKGIFIPAPPQSLALKWLREVHNIEISISYGFPIIDGKQVFKYFWCPVKVTEKGLEYPMDNPNTAEFNEEMADSYEEAVEAALKYTLENLI